MKPKLLAGLTMASAPREKRSPVCAWTMGQSVNAWFHACTRSASRSTSAKETSSRGDVHVSMTRWWRFFIRLVKTLDLSDVETYSDLPTERSNHLRVSGVVESMESAAIELGPFVMSERLTTGGMGEVWRGRHRSQDVDVAIKVITSSRASSPEYQSRFRREVQAVAQLSHPHVVSVYDCGLLPWLAAERSRGLLVARSPYLVMELSLIHI